MSNKPVLVIMAAGMGSRYGGLKQLDPVGSHGQLIIDYSIYDAKRAGFETVVFVIKPEIEADFKEAIGDRVSKVMDVKYAYQLKEDLPEGYSVPAGRTKPWGTAHAALAARNIVDGPFAVINADDYYGPEAYQEIYNYLSTHADGDMYEYVMVGYLLKNTVTENGTVARGVCEETADHFLTQVTERTKIEKGEPPVHRGRRGHLDRPVRRHHRVHEHVGLHPQLFGRGPGPLPRLPGQDPGREPGEGGVLPAHRGQPAHRRGQGPGEGAAQRGQVVRRHLPGGQAHGGGRHHRKDRRRALSRPALGGVSHGTGRTDPARGPGGL